LNGGLMRLNRNWFGLQSRKNGEDNQMAAGTLQAKDLGIISNQAADKIVAALDRNTAVLLTVSSEIVAFSSLQNRKQSLTDDEIKMEVLQRFNRFLVSKG
jgi:hypothetical protein